VREGEGPGEVREANGIVLSGDTLLWVNDHGRWAIVGVDLQGEELRRFSKPIRSYGYIWDGTFDRQGRYWRQDQHADDEEEVVVDEETGLYEGSFRVYYKSYDLSTEEVDSVYMGESTYRGYASVRERGSSYYGLPFAVSDIAVVKPVRRVLEREHRFIPPGSPRRGSIEISPSRVSRTTVNPFRLCARQMAR